MRPWSSERRISPFGGDAQDWVYSPVATQTLAALRGSAAIDSTPSSFQSLKPVESSSGTHLPAAASLRYAPPMSVRA